MSLLDDDARAFLLAWARACIAQRLSGTPVEEPRPPPPPAAAPGGCFVSLHTRDGSLRGCIGTFDDSKPLWRNVQDMAVAASTRDPRFAPLRVDDLPRCVIEISALTPRRPGRPEDVEVGRHGLAVRLGRFRGVLLPQVATAEGWDRETFLQHTCRKAGLPSDAWRDPAIEIELFEAEVFGEPHRPEFSGPPR